MRPHDLAAALTEIIARHTQSQAVWRKEPVNWTELKAIRADIREYFKRAEHEQAEAEIMAGSKG